MEKFWIFEDSIAYRLADGPKGCGKIAGFDMDGTLITTKSGAKFPKTVDDWQWWNPLVVKKLVELSSNGYEIVIFTNQAGIGKKRISPHIIYEKVDAMLDQLQVSISVFVSTHNDIYRKPASGLWERFCAVRKGPAIDLSESFYCGDAAGRPKVGKKKRDFSCSDRKFAANCGLAFYTPEEVFLKQLPCAKWEWRSRSPRSLLVQYSKPQAEIKWTSTVQELVILVGSPASGKSRIANYFGEHGYECVNQDRFRTKGRCLKVCRQALAQGKSVVIDRTNPTASERAEFMKLSGPKVSTRCIHLTTSREMCEHLNGYRIKVSNRLRVPNIAFNIYFSKLEAPGSEEGFNSTETRDISLRFEKESDKGLFLQWT